MTKEDARELSILLSAYSEGKIIQVSNNGEYWVEFSMASPENIFGYCYHRIKSEPKLVPFTYEDRDLFKDRWIIFNEEGRMLKVTTIDKSCIWLGGFAYTYLEML